VLNVSFSIRILSFEKDAVSGLVSTIKAEKLEVAEKPKAYLHWVPAASSLPVTARQYNSLFTVEEPNGLDWKNGGYVDALNPNSEVIFKDALIEPGFKELGKEKGNVVPVSGASDDLVRFQAVRTGYFCVDTESSEGALVLNQIVSLKEDSGKGKGK
jgi:glutaminyl-tRNA synthetase